MAFKNKEAPTPNYEYEGNIVKCVYPKNSKGQVVYTMPVLITVKNTVNKDYNLLSAYINGKRIKGMRYIASRPIMQVTADFINAIEMEYV